MRMAWESKEISDYSISDRQFSTELPLCLEVGGIGFANGQDPMMVVLVSS